MSLLSRLFGGEQLAPAAFEAHDLTDARSLVLIRHELRAREVARLEARRKSYAARQRFAWLKRAAGAVLAVLRRPDHPPAGRTAPDPARLCERCSQPIDYGTHCRGCREVEIKASGQTPPCAWCADELGGDCLQIVTLDSLGALRLARTVAERDGNRPLRDALHYLLVLDCAGAVPDVLPFLSKISRAKAQKDEVN
jgi:hypothetical protein